MHRPSQCCRMMTAFVLCGHMLCAVGSAHAEEISSVAADLVDLAVSVSDTLADIEEAELLIPFYQQQHRKGFVDHSELLELQNQQRASQRKLDLLRLIVEAEINATSYRTDYFRSLIDAPSPSNRGDAALGYTQAKERLRVLTFLKDTCETPEEGADATAVEPAQKRGTITGVVRVIGEVPDLPHLSTKRTVRSLGQAVQGEAGQSASSPCGEDTVPDESLLVGTNGGLANVFVYLRNAPEGIHTPIPEEAALISAHNCRFEPHCSIVRVGQSVQCRNLDRGATNFRFTPSRNSPQNRVVAASDDVGFTFENTRLEPFPFFLRSDNWPWMSACQLVVDHPFAGLTDEEGRFSVTGLPDGEHVFRVWHERIGYIEKELTIAVGGSEPTEVEVTVEAERLLKDESTR